LLPSVHERDKHIPIRGDVNRFTPRLTTPRGTTLRHLSLVRGYGGIVLVSRRFLAL
jgi:hypothetical protein